MSLLTASAPTATVLVAHVPFARLAWWAVLAVGVLYGLGDIAQISAFNSVLLSSVHALVPVAIGLALLGAARSRSAVSVSPPGLMLSGVTWLAVLTLSAALAPSHRPDALAAVTRPAAGVLLAWTVCQLCADRARWLRLAQAVATGGLFVAAMVLAEAAGVQPVQAWLDSLQDGEVPIGDVPRAAATLSHPNEAAILLELSLPLVIAWAWTTPSRWRLALFIGAGGTLAALVLTFSRAGMVAGFAALGVLTIACVRVRNWRGWLRSLGILALVAPLTLAWAALFYPGLDHRLAAGLDEASALQPARSEFWRLAVQMLRDQPLLGVGPDNFRWRFGDYSGLSADNLGIHAHNQYLETLADTGVLGFAAFVAFLIVLVGLAIRRSGESAWRAALLASMLAWLVHAVLSGSGRHPSRSGSSQAWSSRDIKERPAFTPVAWDGALANSFERLSYPARWVSPLMRSAVPRARISSSPVTLPRPSFTEPLT